MSNNIDWATMPIRAYCANWNEKISFPMDLGTHAFVACSKHSLFAMWLNGDELAYTQGKPDSIQYSIVGGIVTLAGVGKRTWSIITVTNNAL